MKKNYLVLLGVLVAILFLSGCLTCEKKEYTFEMTGKDAGRLTIKFVNIMSTMDDTVDVSMDDFNSLLTDYLEGTEIENGFANATVISKRLFEEDGVLNGEIIFEFTGINAANLYQYKGKGPLMYCLGCNSLDSEYYSESNGEYGGDVMPVVFWESGEKTLTLTTDVTSPDETTISLLDHWYDYQKGQ
jgi:hypothetical protein